MASPLSVFRKHQYWFLVGLGVLLMVAFVVLPPVDDYLRQRTLSGGTAARAVVLRWKGGKLTEGELQSMRHSHRLTMNFLDEVLRLTRERRGVPKGPLPQYFGGDGDQELVATMLLAAKAEELGMVISDEAVQDYLDRLSDRLLAPEDFEKIFKQVSGGRLPVGMLFLWLRRLLMAHYLREHVLMSAAAMTPADSWQNFLRVHQKTSLEILPVAVADFLSQVPRDPTEQELRQLYEQYKERYPDPMSPVPGFRRLPKTNFAYVRIDVGKLIAEEKERISQDEILKEYEEGLKRGDYRKPPSSSGPAAPMNPPQNPSGAQANPLTNDKENATQPAPPDSASDSKNQQTNQSETPSDKSDSRSGQDQAGPADSPPDATTEQSDTATSSEAATQQPTANQESTEAQGSTESQQSTNANSEADKKNTEPAQAKQASEGAAVAGNEQVPPQTGPSERPPPATTSAGSQGEPVPLEEVRDRILDRLARPRAQKRRDEIVDTIRRQMDRYFQSYTIWEQRPSGDSSPRPTPPDPQTWVERFGVAVGQTGLVDFYSVEKTDLGRTSRFDSQSFRFRAFREVAFDPEVPLFRVREIVDIQNSDIEYVYWKIEEQPESVPTFDEARSEVEQAWRKEEARKLARQRAEQLQQEAAQREGTLRERLPEYADKVFEPPAFTWISWGATLGLRGLESPGLSDVEGVEGESWEFMQAVFSTAPDAVGLATNAPQDHFYVFRTVKREPPESELQKLFLESFGQSFREYDALVSARLQNFYRDWYRQLEESMAVRWERAADESERR